MVLDGVGLCDRCFDRRMTVATGYPRLPEAPPPEDLAGPDGRLHRFRYRLWRAPTGIVGEAEEIGRGPDEGYHVEVLGSHEADAGELMARVRDRLKQRVGRLELEDRAGCHPILAGHEVTGRLVWSGEDKLYDVIVDGRRLSWSEFGRALEPFEGWEFRLAFQDKEPIAYAAWEADGEDTV